MIKGFQPLSKKFFGGWGGSGTTSGWEKSYYGGYSRTILDHPSLNYSSKLNIESENPIFEDKEVLTDWDLKKLCRIFLYTCNKENLTDTLMRDAVQGIRKVGFYPKQEKKVLLIQSSTIEEVIDHINSHELKPLFNYYKSVIANTDFFVEIPEPQDENSGKGDDGEENDEENDSMPSSEGEENSSESKKGKSKEEQEIESLNAAMDSLKELIEEIQPYSIKSFFDSKSRTFETITSKLVKAKESSTIFSKDEILVGDTLVKMLDIDFESKPDIVKNLKLGKMDISKIAEVPAGNVQIYQQTLEEQTTQPFSFVILTDLSGSMNGNKLETQYSLTKSLYYALSQILPQDKLFVYGHSGMEDPIIYTFHDPYYQEFNNTIDKMLTISLGENYDGPVIHDIHKKVRKLTNDRIILLVISDGQPCGYDYGNREDVEDLKRAIEKCKRDEFVPIGIGISAPYVKEIYPYSTVINDLKTIGKDVSGIINRVIKSEFQ